MSDPDPATTAFLAKLVGDRELEPGEWFSATLADAHEGLAAARPLIVASALADAHLVPDSLVAVAVRDERQRIRPLRERWHAEADAIHNYGDAPAAVRATLRKCALELADLLGGDGDA